MWRAAAASEEMFPLDEPPIVSGYMFFVAPHRLLKKTIIAMECGPVPGGLDKPRAREIIRRLLKAGLVVGPVRKGEKRERELLLVSAKARESLGLDLLPLLANPHLEIDLHPERSFDIAA